MPPAATVIFKMLDELLRQASKSNGELGFAKNPATGVVYRYVGAYLLEFVGGTDPDKAKAIFLNGRAIGREELICLLNLDSEASLEIARKYHHPWIDALLEKQKSRLRGRCDE